MFGCDVKELIKNFNKIDNLEKEVLEYRFGIKDGKIYTLYEIGKLYNKTREEIRQIEARAIRKIRNFDSKNMI